MVDGSCIGELESGDQNWVAVVAAVVINVVGIDRKGVVGSSSFPFSSHPTLSHPHKP